jgi:glycosyltransferase involved in cell wall biosynthesis
MAQTISVVMPTRNEWRSLAPTIRSVASTCHSGALRQIVVVDDHSLHACGTRLDALRSQLEGDSIELLVIRNTRRLGVAGARNAAVRHASGDVLFITDGHVRFTPGWDAMALGYLEEKRIVAATIRDPRSAFIGYGCELVVPCMGTRWLREPREAVQVACSVGTIVHRNYFLELGGYDEGMQYYGAIEPEFSLRAWLAGAEIVSAPDLEVFHRFKPPITRDRFFAAQRAGMVYNALRFGLLYLDRPAVLQMLRYFASTFAEESRAAYEQLLTSDVWERREMLERSLVRDFRWFINRFQLHDQAERPLSA